jgi:hypothetical protein
MCCARLGQNQGKSTMSNDQDSDKNIPFMQRVIDNPFLLLFIGITIPTLTYIVWGIMELVSLPVSQ